MVWLRSLAKTSVFVFFVPRVVYSWDTVGFVVVDYVSEGAQLLHGECGAQLFGRIARFLLLSLRG